MKTIYQMAEEVIIWLGVGDEQSAKAMKLIKHYGSKSLDSHGLALAPNPDSESSDSYRPTSTLDSERAVNAFISNPYWKRVWII
jgi:hypothetical protein